MQGGTLNATNLNNLGATSNPANLQPLGLTSSFTPGLTPVGGALLGATSSLTCQLNIGNASTATNSNNASKDDVFVPVFAGAAIKPAGYSGISPDLLTSVGNDTMPESSNKNFVSPTLGTGDQKPSAIGIVTPFNTSIKAPAQKLPNIAGILGSPQQQQQGHNQQKSLLNSNSNNNQHIPLQHPSNKFM